MIYFYIILLSLSIFEAIYLFGVNEWIRVYVLIGSEWRIAFKAIKSRTVKILKNIRILSYFLVSIVFLGAAGIWFPWLQQQTSFSSYFRGDNLFTFAIALLGGLLCNKIYHADSVIRDIFSEFTLELSQNDSVKSSDMKNIILKRRNKYKEQIVLSAVGLFLGCIALICIIYAYSSSPNKSSLVGFLGLLLALGLYLFSTADEIDENTQVREINGEADEVIDGAPFGKKENMDVKKILRDKHE